ncbi:MAG TPA: hypothetical protein HPQ04_09900 [Rhodospirillaceae bacterium]|nr:hypothetical protein [Rhodospirillaceae bacterium]
MARIYSFSAALATATLCLLAWQPAAAADANQEIATAVTHAGLAAGSGEQKVVSMHLHHVVNCLVGPNGADFDASAGNPCKDQGAGALVDAPAKKGELETALALAKSGLTATDIAKAKEKAVETQTALKKAGM